MLLDISRPFEDICTDKSFREALCDLQTILSPRSESEAWARRLRFLTPAPDEAIPSDSSDNETNSEDDESTCYEGWKFEATREEDTLMVTGTEDFPDYSHYIAVSWRWSFKGESRPSPTAPDDFYIRDVSAMVKRPCTVLMHILSRAVAYDSFYEVPFLWFDKECINQSDPQDQQLGI